MEPRLEETLETYVIPLGPLYSLPLRMPGLTLEVHCSVPSFQLTLKGGCDEGGLFEPHQEPGRWALTPLNLALGRLVYDIIWEEGLVEASPVQLRVVYATLVPSSPSTEAQAPLQHVLVPRTWQMTFHPRRWIPLPKSKHLLKRIQLRPSSLHPPPDPTSLSTSLSTSPPTPLTPVSPTSPPALPTFRLAVATIPLKILSLVSSPEGVLNLEQQNHPVLEEQGLNFSHVFGAWLVLDDDIDWTPQIAYWTTAG